MEKEWGGVVSGRTASLVEEDFVVESQLEFGHARQVALHLNRADNLAAQHGARAGHHEVHALHNI